MHISQRDSLCVQMTDRCRLDDKVLIFSFANTILLAYAVVFRSIPRERDAKAREAMAIVAFTSHER